MSKKTNNQVQERAAKPRPALDPESLALVQPWKEFVSRGWVQELSSTWTPTGTKITVRLSKELDSDAAELPPGLAKEKIISSGKWAPKGAKMTEKEIKAPARPKKSLVKEDFDDGPDKVRERVAEIAKALGPSVAKGRIGSLKLMIEGANTFDKWWAQAPPQAKIRLFADKKHADSFDKTTVDNFGKLVNGGCPFRGPVPTPSKDEEEA